jgi:hypothetical protein
LIGRRIFGPIGHAIDIFAVVGTMFGVATSLGLGVLQVNAGFGHLLGVPVGTPAQLVLIAVITGLATISVVLGLDRGIKRLSELNIMLAVLLLAFVLITGPTLFLLQAYVQNIGAYLGTVVPRTFRLYAYEPNPWLGDWTLFYWAWWIAWSPFVGMFIARISRGRTVREFVAGVLLVPTGFSFLWMTVFGNTAMALDMGEAAGAIATAVQADLYRPVPVPLLPAGIPDHVGARGGAGDHLLRDFRRFRLARRRHDRLRGRGRHPAMAARLLVRPRRHRSRAAAARGRTQGVAGCNPGGGPAVRDHHDHARLGSVPRHERRPARRIHPG